MRVGAHGGGAPSTSTVLADYTTLGLGGPAREFVSADSEAELVHTVRNADKAGVPVLLIGGGSNLVISDEGFPGTAVHVNTRGITYVAVGDGVVDITVAAGADWDNVVAASVAQGLAGLESLSGIPGRAGATPIQNVGAYGREVAEVITKVRVYDRQDDQVKVIPNEFCQFAYRTSLFKSGQPESLVAPGNGASPRALGQPRYLVLDVTFRLPRQPLLLALQPAQVVPECGGLVGLPLQHGGDLGQPEPELAEQQDALQTHERTLVVVAVSVAADAAGLQQADVVVVPQRAARRSDQPCQLLDRQLDDIGGARKRERRAGCFRVIPHDNDGRR